MTEVKNNYYGYEHYFDDGFEQINPNLIEFKKIKKKCEIVSKREDGDYCSKDKKCSMKNCFKIGR